MTQRGIVNVEVNHFCGKRLTVVIHWSFSPGKRYLRNGDPGYPDEWDEEWQVFDTAGRTVKDVQCCPKCGVDLDYDDLFHATVKRTAEGQYQTEDEDDWETPEPDDYRDTGEDRMWEPDPGDLLPPGRAG